MPGLRVAACPRTSPDPRDFYASYIKGTVVVAAEHGAESVPELIRIAAAHGFAADPRADGHLVVAAPPDFVGTFNREAALRGVTLVELHRETPGLEETFFQMLGEGESP